MTNRGAPPTPPEDFLRTRNHSYPTYLLFVGGGEIQIMKRAVVTTKVADLAIASGAAIPLPHRFDGVALSLGGNRKNHFKYYPAMWHEFLLMMKNPDIYTRGWVDFLLVAAKDFATKRLWLWVRRLFPAGTYIDRLPPLLLSVAEQAVAQWEAQYVASHSLVDEFDAGRFGFDLALDDCKETIELLVDREMPGVLTAFSRVFGHSGS